MRVDRLDLLAYGPFTEKSLNLADGGSGLHLIYGDNEAGKSTSLRAFIALLFGIQPRTHDNFLHLNQQLRVGGKLTLSDGRSIEFVRRKGTKGTLLDHRTGAALDDSILMPFLPGSVDENLFKKLYGIDHPRLVAGGQELLNQAGDIGQALFSAAVGTESLREILMELQNGAEELFKPQASTKIVNQAIAQFKSAQKQIKDSILPVSEWKRLQAAVVETLSDIKRIENDITIKNKEKSRLSRVTRVKGALAQRCALLVRLEALGEVLVLPEGFDEDRKMASNKYQVARETRQKAEAKLTRLVKESESTIIRQELLDNEEAIIALHKALGAVEKTIQDRPQQDGKRRLLKNEAETLLKGVRPDIELGGADRLRPLLNNRKWISSLAQEHGLLTQRQEELNSGLRDLKGEQISLESELSEQRCSHLDLGELKATISTVRKPGDIEQRLAELQKRSFEERETCRIELARLGRFSGTTENLLKVAMPVSETLDTFEKRIDENTEQIKDFERSKQKISEEIKDAEQNLNTLLLTSDVPAISELEALRTMRNKGWHLIKRKYIEKAHVEKDIAEYAPDSELQVVYEQKIESADYMADQLRLAADQVVKRADLEATIDSLGSRLKILGEEIHSSTGTLKKLNEKWNGIWEPLGIDPGTPREMKQWVLRVDTLLASVRAANSTLAAERELVTECKKLKELISLQLSTFAQIKSIGEMSLEAMINLCEQYVKQEETTLERRRYLEHSINESKVRLKRTAKEIKVVERDRAKWQQEWGEAIEGLGLKPDVHPERATGATEQLVLFFDKFDKSEELRKRIYGMEQVEENFTKAVYAFVESIGYDRDGQEATSIAIQLNRDLGKTRELRASLDKNEAQCKELNGEIEDTNITIKLVEDQLALMRVQANVETDDELILVCERSAKKRDLHSKRDMLEQELTRNGDGLTIEELENETEKLDIDSIDGEQERISLELAELLEKRDQLRDQRQTLQNEIRSKDGNTQTTRASEEVEEQRARILSGTEHYLRLKIAALILEQQIENYRRENQAPVLARAGRLFSKLTLGSYAHLRDELDDSGKPVLLGVRPNDGEVSIGGMSDGTRDQLYLALRLATLELHLKKGEPLPFVVDDILIAFDDSRTRACLEVLAELSASTQVLLFTHHRRVLELADRIRVKEGIYKHEL